jgi:Resolvase, N terminal domain
MGIENMMAQGEPQAMRIGYARVSTRDQNPEMQLDALKKAGCVRIYTDKLSGAQVERPGLRKALSHLREADTLVVWKLDRLGRSVKALVDLVNELETQKVHFQSITDGVDTKTPAGRSDTRKKSLFALEFRSRHFNGCSLYPAGLRTAPAGIDVIREKYPVLYIFARLRRSLRDIDLAYLLTILDNVEVPRVNLSSCGNGKSDTESEQINPPKNRAYQKPTLNKKLEHIWLQKVRPLESSRSVPPVNLLQEHIAPLNQR